MAKTSVQAALDAYKRRMEQSNSKKKDEEKEYADKMDAYSTGRLSSAKSSSTTNSKTTNKYNVSDPSVAAALNLRERTIANEFPSIYEDLTKRYNAEIEAYNNAKTPSFGKGAYESTVKSQTTNRANISTLRNEIEAYRRFLGDEAADSMLGTLDQIKGGYDSYVYMSKFDTKEDYDNEIRYSSMSVDDYTKAIEEAEKALKLSYERDVNKAVEANKNSFSPTPTRESEETKALEKELAQLKARKPLAESRAKAAQYESYRNDALFNRKSANGLKDYYANQDSLAKKEREETASQSWWEKIAINIGKAGQTTEQAVIDTYREDTSYMEPNDNWTQEQLDMFGYLYDDDPNTALEYAISVNDEISTGKANKQKAKISDSATSGFWAGAGHTAGAVATSAFGLADYLDNLMEYSARGRTTAKDFVTPFDYSQEVTGSISQELNENYGTLNEKIPVIGGKGWGDVYGLGTSVAQSALSAYTGGQIGTFVTFFGSAGAAAVDDAKERGATDEQALAIGGLAGTAEGLAEMLGVDKLLGIGSSHTMRALITNIAKQAVSEGLEEGTTTLLNNFADQLVMQDKSAFNQLVQQYILEYGMSEDEAKTKAWKDMAEDLAFDMLGGFVSGGVHAGPQTAVQTIKSNSQAKSLYGDSQQGLVDLAMQSQPGTLSRQLAIEYQKQLDEGKPLSSSQLARLSEAHQQQVLTDKNTGVQTQVQDRLTALGETGDIATISSAIVKQINDESLSSTERKALRNSTYGESVASEFKDADLGLGLEEYVNLVRGAQSTYNQSKLTAETNEQVDAETAKTQQTTTDEATPTATPQNLVVTEEMSTQLNEASQKYGAQAQTMVKAYQPGQDVQKFDNAYEVAFNEGKKLGSLTSLEGKDAVSYLTDEQLVSAYEAGVDAAGIDSETQRAYEMGKAGQSLEEALGSKALRNLTKEQITESFNKGVEAADTTASTNAQAIQGIAGGTTTSTRKQGVVRGEGVNGNKLDQRFNSTQRKAFKVLSTVANVTGIDIVLYESKTDAQGNFVGDQGRFEHGDPRTIYLDLNAGLNKITDVGNLASYVMLRTFNHEFVHYLEYWNPVQYNLLKRVVFAEINRRGGNVSDLIEAEIMKAGVDENGNNILSYEDASHEVLAEALTDILPDSNFVETLATKHNDLFHTLLNKLHEFLDNIKSYFSSISKNSPAAAKAIQQEYDGAVHYLEDIVKLFDEVAVGAVENMQAAGTNATDENHKFVKAFVKKTKEISRSNRRVVDKHKEDLQKSYSADSALSLNTITSRYNKIIEMWDKIGGELNSKFLQEWNNKADRPFTIFKAQSGYKYNVELSSMCKKGVPLFEAIDTIVKQEVMKELDTEVLGKEEKEILYDILQQHNFEIPCAICYVEQARQREGAIIDSFLNGKVEKDKNGKTTTFKLGWNEVLSSVEAEMKANGVDYTIPSVSREIATDAYTPASMELDDETYTAFKNAVMKIANEEIKRYNKESKKNRKLLSDTSPAAIKASFSGTLPSNLKIFKVLLTEPSSVFKIESDLLYSSMTTRNLSTAHNGLYGLFNSQGGVSGYKTKQGTTVYWGEILQKKWSPSTIRKEGGVRNQSNSDFQIYTLLDQAQMYIDFTAKGFYLQAYTKVLAELKLFGLSSGKINASLIPAVHVYRNSDGSIDVAKTMENAGLDKAGNPIYDDIEGINHTEAFMLIEDAEYSKNITGICIGYSDKHINKLLDDPRVQLIIGFHDKTDNPDKRYRGARYAKNYNGLNEAVNSEGKTVHIGFNQFVKKAENLFKFNEETETFEGTIKRNGKTYVADDIPMIAADMYLEMCEKKGYSPAYKDFAQHPNYYKLLADFGLYDSQGHYAPHRKVSYNMPDQVPYLDINGNKQYMSTEDYIKAELEKELAVRDSISEALADTSENGIIPQFKKAVQDRGVVKRHITRETTDAERYNLLKNRSINLKAKVDENKLSSIEQKLAQSVEGLELLTLSDRKKLFKKLGDEFGVFKSYENLDINLTFNFSKGNMAESISKQQKNFKNFAKMFSCFDEVIDTAIGIEVHNRNAEGYKVDPTLKDTYVLVSAFEDGNNVIPVKLEIKEFSDKPNSLYVAIALESIKKDEVVKQGNTNSGVTQDSRSSVLSLAELFSKINPSDTSFLKYIPKGFSEESESTTRRSRRPSADNTEYAPVFYSQMAKVVEGMKQDKFGATSVVSMLRGRGVKAEEIKWSGIEAWLDGKKSVTKDELLEFIAGSDLQIEEEQTTNSVSLQYKGENTYELHDADGNVLDTFIYNSFIGGYVSDKTEEIYSYIYQIEDAVRKEHGNNSLPRWADYKLRGGTKYREIVFKLPDSSYSNQAMRVHWGDDATGILAHARLQDFNIDGKKMLFVEEIQSDWHNKGHKSGYLTGAESSLVADKAPDAPFKDNYHEYVLKRLLREAAEKGYDSIGWTTADTQSWRWSVDYAESYRIEYDQDIPKFLSKYGKKWDAKVGKTTLDNGTEVWSMPITDSMKDSVLYEGQTRYQRRSNTLTDREVLSKAANEVDTNYLTDGEKFALDTFKKRLTKLETLEQQRQGLLQQRQDVKEKSGEKSSEYKQLSRQLQIVNKDISKARDAVLDVEEKKVLRDVLKKARTVVEAEEKTRGDEKLDRWRERRNTSAEMRKYRERIRKTIRDLDKVLNRGDKKQHVKADLRGVVSDTLRSAEILFMEEYDSKDMIRNGIGTELDEKETTHLLAAKAILSELDNIDSKQFASSMEKEAEKAKLKNKLDYRMAQLSSAFERERYRLSNTKISAVLTDIADTYSKLPDSEYDYIRNAYDENVHQFLKDLRNKVGGTLLVDMTPGQAQQLSMAYTMVLTTVRDANKAFAANIRQTREELGNAVMTEVRKAGGEHKYRSKTSKVINSFAWNNLKPVYAFERIGSKTLGTLADNLANGENTIAQDLEEARKFRTDIAKKYGYNNWDFKKTFTFESSSGRTFSLNLQQIMSLYAYSKRPAAHDHITKGGIVFKENAVVVVDKKGLKRSYLNEDASAYTISDELLYEILSNKYITQDQKKFVDDMQTYLSDTMGAKGNEISMKLYGVELFGEKNYFPLRTSGSHLSKAKETELRKEQGQISIVNSGFTKATQPGASTPIIMDDFIEVWAEHVVDMSQYHGLVLPLEDFRRTYSYKHPAAEGGDNDSVDSVIKTAYGSAATRYIDQFISDVNGGIVADPREGFVKSFISKFKKASVVASLSVVVQQPSAIYRAMPYVGRRYFGVSPIAQGIVRASTNILTKEHTRLWNEAKKYAPGVTIIKEIGGFDTSTGYSLKDYLTVNDYDTGRDKFKAIFKDEQYRGQAMDEVLGRLPAVADELAWVEIWQAVKRETKAKMQSELKKQGSKATVNVTSEEFLKRAGERFTEVIRKTQVYDSIFSKSANMRSKSGLMAMMTAFMAEPTTIINMAEDAVRKVAKGDIKMGARIATAVAYSLVFNNICRAIIYAMRDDDEEETYLEKYAEALASGLVDDMVPLNYFPFLRDMWSVLVGYDVERADMSVISDLVNAINNASEVFSKDVEGMDDEELATHNKACNEATFGVIDWIAALFGIPVKNIRRDIKGVINTIDVANKDVAERDSSLASVTEKIKNAIWDSLPEAIRPDTQKKKDSLYNAIISGDQAYYDRLASGYSSESQLNAALRSALRDNDPRIKAAAEAKFNGNLTEYTRIAKEIIAEGLFSQNNIVAAINSEIAKLTPDDGTDPSQKATGLYTADDFALAIAQGDTTLANAIKADIIATSELNGKTSDKAEESFRSGAKNACKELLLAGDLTTDEAVEALVKFCDLEKSKAQADVRYWEFKNENPDTYVDDVWFDTYYEKVASSGIDINMYMEYRNDVADITGEGKKEGRMAVIHSLPITVAQKDALYFAEGWAESTLHEAPWH